MGHGCLVVYQGVALFFLNLLLVYLFFFLHSKTAATVRPSDVVAT